VEAEDSRTAELEWQADEERRCAAVTAAKAEILRLEQASIDEETARVRRDIATLQRVRKLGCGLACFKM
jgi:hypothetical protein